MHQSSSRAGFTFEVFVDHIAGERDATVLLSTRLHEGNATIIVVVVVVDQATYIGGMLSL